LSAVTVPITGALSTSGQGTSSLTTLALRFHQGEGDLAGELALDSGAHPSQGGGSLVLSIEARTSRPIFLDYASPSANFAKQRPSLGRPPSISFNNRPNLEFGHRERSPRRGYFDEHEPGDGYDGLGIGDLSPDDTNEPEGPGGYFRKRKHGREGSESERQAWFKRRKESDYEDQGNASS
jgi:hypothetical protein